MFINEELRKLIPPLTNDEFNQLEENILQDGCRDALVVWDETLVDGHNRYEICTKHNIDYKTKPIYFKSLDEVKLWMINNQKGRRNLSDGWRYQLSQTSRAILAEMGRENLKKPTGGKNSLTLSTIDKVVAPHNTREEIAKDLGWSTGKVAMADKVWKQADPEVKQAILDDRLTINTANTLLEFDKEEQKEIIAKIIAKPEEKPTEIVKRYVHVSSSQNDWYTPAMYINAACSVLGKIDLDPASSEYAQETVQASTYYTKDTNGLDKEWRGNVWLNPPYSFPEIQQFINKLIESNVDSWIVLVNNSSDTNWFHTLLNNCSCFCITKGRVQFENTSTEKLAARQGQFFFYYGENTAIFEREFSHFGKVIYVDNK